MNLFQKWVLQAFDIQSHRLKHIERKLDHLSEHLGAQLPAELLQAGADLDQKTKALQAALEGAQAQQPTTKEPA